MDLDYPYKAPPVYERSGYAPLVPTSTTGEHCFLTRLAVF